METSIWARFIRPIGSVRQRMGHDAAQGSHAARFPQIGVRIFTDNRLVNPGRRG